MPQPVENEVGGRQHWWPLLLVAFLFLLVLVGELIEYRSERGVLGRRSPIGRRSAERVDIEVSVTFVAFDGIRGELLARIDVEPSKLAGTTLPGGLELVTSTTRGESVQRLENGLTRQTIEVSLPALGYACDYPFDLYQGKLQLRCRTLPEGRPLRTRFELASHLPTLEATATPMLPGGAAEPMGFYFCLARPPLVKGFSLFINFMVWLIGLAILGITTAVACFGRKVEVNKFGFMAGMLFAFPVARNLQPGVPPLGIGLDYFVTFWAQGIAGCGLLVCCLVWMFRQK